MHLILPPLLTRPRLPLERRLAGRLAVDLSPRKGATVVADEAITAGAMVLYYRRRGGCRLQVRPPLPGHYGIYSQTLSVVSLVQMWLGWLTFSGCLVSLSSPDQWKKHCRRIHCVCWKFQSFMSLAGCHTTFFQLFLFLVSFKAKSFLSTNFLRCDLSGAGKIFYILS